ncbi:hypothetical protein [Egbenema bharatensis]|uniref:hypothetical protein n=1 Tax=Egbenema bharatensis TaxID=3463334 RepID=UPI003A83D8F9
MVISASPIKLTIQFIDNALDPEERDEQAQTLINELRTIDEVETVSRVLDPNPPQGNKAIGGVLIGLLTAEISHENIKGMFHFLSDRLRGKPIELEVEANGKKLKVTASSREELEIAIQAAQRFVAT